MSLLGPSEVLVNPRAVHSKAWSGEGIGWTDEVTGYARYFGAWVCKSRAGRWRPVHSLDRDSKCCFCDRVIE